MLVACLPLTARAGDPFADAVVSFMPGEHAGFNADKLPDIVLGPPRGAGDIQGGLDVVSLGDGGSITLAFRDNIICDQPGLDFTVFENAFHAGTPSGPVFTEVGIIAVSQDGEHFVNFPYDPQTLAGLAGLTPVYSNPDNGVDPTDPAVSGGDHFDLADIGLEWAAYVRITDPGNAIPDAGSRVPTGNSGGFDLDAIAAIHSCDPPDATPPASATPTATATPPPTEVILPTTTASPTETALPTETPTVVSPTATATPTDVVASTTPASPTVTPVSGDVNGNGVIDADDLAALLHAMFTPDDRFEGAADLNGDGVVSAADVTVMMQDLAATAPAAADLGDHLRLEGLSMFSQTVLRQAQHERLGIQFQ